MGCGCGGGRRNARSARSVAPSQALQSGSVSRQTRIQSNERQALIQDARQRIQQANGVQQQQISILNEQQQKEKKRRIQVSLRNRNNRINRE